MDVFAKLVATFIATTVLASCTSGTAPTQMAPSHDSVSSPLEQRFVV
jgi:hypothetical protein